MLTPSESNAVPGAFRRFLASCAAAPLWLICAAIVLPCGLLLLLFYGRKGAPETAGTDPAPGAAPEPGEGAAP